MSVSYPHFEGYDGKIRIDESVDPGSQSVRAQTVMHIWEAALERREANGGVSGKRTDDYLGIKKTRSSGDTGMDATSMIYAAARSVQVVNRYPYCSDIPPNLGPRADNFSDSELNILSDEDYEIYDLIEKLEGMMNVAYPPLLSADEIAMLYRYAVMPKALFTRSSTAFTLVDVETRAFGNIDPAGAFYAARNKRSGESIGALTYSDRTLADTYTRSGIDNIKSVRIFMCGQMSHTRYDSSGSHYTHVFYVNRDVTSMFNVSHLNGTITVSGGTIDHDYLLGLARAYGEDIVSGYGTDGGRSYVYAPSGMKLCIEIDTKIN